MNTSKKILLICKAISIIVATSSLIAWSFMTLFAVNFWAMFIIGVVLQLIFPELKDTYIFSKNVRDSLKEYADKPFRKYEIPLTCQYCGSKEVIDVDLNNTTYKCQTCDRKNAVYVSFMTAAISDE